MSDAHESHIERSRAMASAILEMDGQIEEQQETLKTLRKEREKMIAQLVMHDHCHVQESLDFS